MLHLVLTALFALAGAGAQRNEFCWRTLMENCPLGRIRAIAGQCMCLHGIKDLIVQRKLLPGTGRPSSSTCTTNVATVEETPREPLSSEVDSVSVEELGTESKASDQERSSSSTCITKVATIEETAREPLSSEVDSVSVEELGTGSKASDQERPFSSTGVANVDKFKETSQESLASKDEGIIAKEEPDAEKDTSENKRVSSKENAAIPKPEIVQWSVQDMDAGNQRVRPEALAHLSEENNIILEEAFQKFARNPTEATTVIYEANSDWYKADFVQCTQYLMENQTRKRILIRNNQFLPNRPRAPGGKRNQSSSKKISSTVKWLAQDPNFSTSRVIRDQCVEFSTVHNEIFEVAYQRFLKDSNRNTVIFHVGPYEYKADFSKRRQFRKDDQNKYRLLIRDNKFLKPM